MEIIETSTTIFESIKFKLKGSDMIYEFAFVRDVGDDHFIILSNFDTDFTYYVELKHDQTYQNVRNSIYNKIPTARTLRGLTDSIDKLMKVCYGDCAFKGGKTHDTSVKNPPSCNIISFADLQG